MRKVPIVSIIIPTFNRAEFLARAIRSVLKQTFQAFEIIVVDDGSSDGTHEIVGNLINERGQYIRHERNSGSAAMARNTGIRAAAGEFIAFLDDDDEWREDKLEKQLEAINGYNAVVCAAIANGSVIRTLKNLTVTFEDLRRGSFDPSSLLARTSVLREVLFDESLRDGEDWDVLIRIAQRYSIRWLPEALLLYNEGNHVRVTNEKKHLSGPELDKRTAMLYKHRDFFGEKWFKFHLADTFLGYIGSRSDKLRCISYAVRRCGAMPVVTVLIDKFMRSLQRGLWARFYMRSEVSLSQQKP
jgi:GalNAc5-diNAcBac-PP-undecaprenol beta-1,3-glucosyltransferase